MATEQCTDSATIDKNAARIRRVHTGKRPTELLAVTDDRVTTVGVNADQHNAHTSIRLAVHVHTNGQAVEQPARTLRDALGASTVHTELAAAVAAAFDLPVDATETRLRGSFECVQRSSTGASTDTETFACSV